MLSDEGKVIEVNVPAHLMDRVHLKSFIEGHTYAHDIIRKEREEYRSAKFLMEIMLAMSGILIVGMGILLFLKR